MKHTLSASTTDSKLRVHREVGEGLFQIRLDDGCYPGASSLESV